MKKYFLFVGMMFLGMALAGFVTICIWIWHVDRTWSPIIEPRIKERQQIGSVRVVSIDKSGQQRWIGSLTAGRTEERQFLKLSEVPPQLVQAIVVLEDPRFLAHGGFDIWGIARATLANLKSLRFSQGGSTLTQQLVKNVFLTPERTLKRKITELILAAMIENRFSKDEILETYVNEVYLGQLGSIEIHGVGRASEYYFNKKVDQLELHEMTLLAAMIAGPGVYNPWKSPEKTMARRNRVLKSLMDAQLILPEEFEESSRRALPSKSVFIAPTRAAYLMDALRENLLKTHSEVEILKGGFDITVGLDLELQEQAEQILRDRAKGIDPQFQGLIIAADPETCEVRAYVGGTNYQITQLDRIRQSRRAIGSLMKPLEISALLETDPSLTLATALEDRPLEWSYDKGRQNWKPSNYDMKFRGRVSLRQSLEESLNVPIVRIFFDRFPSGFLEDAFDSVRAYGLEIPTERALPSAILGAIDQTPMNTMKAFLKLVRQARGLASDPGDSDCRLTLEARTDAIPPLEADTKPYLQDGARMTIAALEGALRRGTSRALGAQLPTNQPWAGKTGTSSDSRDAWYVAMSPRLVVLAWAGRDDNQQTKLTGASGAMPLALPLVLNWSKRAEQAIGWNWPSSSNLVWRPVLKSEFCAPTETTEMLIKSANPEPTSATPPPEAFKYDNKEYIYELFKNGVRAKECP
jgi:penicillin-binding protein 1B